MLAKTYNNDQRWEELKSVADKLGIDIQYFNLSNEDIPIKSGFCKLNGKGLVFLDKKLPILNQMKVLIEAFKNYDTEEIYIASWIREYLNHEIFETKINDSFK